MSAELRISIISSIIQDKLEGNASPVMLLKIFFIILMLDGIYEEAVSLFKSPLEPILAKNKP